MRLQSGAVIIYESIFSFIQGFLSSDVLSELKRGSRLKCVYCKKKGATVGCARPQCKKSYHLPCGLANNSLQQYYDQVDISVWNLIKSPKYFHYVKLIHRIDELWFHQTNAVFVETPNHEDEITPLNFSSSLVWDVLPTWNTKFKLKGIMPMAQLCIWIEDLF